MDAHVPHGDYVCTVEQKAGIAEEHLEGAGPPAAFVDKRVTRFRIAVSSAGRNSKYLVEEKPYSGPDRDTTEWHTGSSVLHGPYRGDGWKFASVEDQAFLRLDIANEESGRLFFYHTGFEYAGGEDVRLSVRFGTCEPVK